MQQLMWTARTLEAEWRQVLWRSVSMRAKEDESSNRHKVQFLPGAEALSFPQHLETALCLRSEVHLVLWVEKEWSCTSTPPRQVMCLINWMQVQAGAVPFQHYQTHTSWPQFTEIYSVSNVNLRHMFATIEKHYNKVTLKNTTNQILSVMTDALMYLVHNTFHYMDIRGDMAYLSS
jgi:hypothetical protein